MNSCKTSANSCMDCLVLEVQERCGLSILRFCSVGIVTIVEERRGIGIKEPLAIFADGAERGVVVRDGRIIELVPRGGQPRTIATSFEAGDHAVLPGLINTHHHFYQTLTRALPAALDQELFPWLQALYPVWSRLTPEALELGVTVAMSELLLSGCTTTTDHHYVFPKGLEEAVVMEVPVASRRGVCGWLNARTWLAHGIHFNAAEMKRLGKAGITISHCACSNQLLASGCCPVCDMEEAGVSIGLGVDGSASNDKSNLMQEVRAAFLLQRARYGVGRVSHKDALRWATKGSAACVGRPELGEIAVGRAADLALFKLDELRFSGHGDPLAALVVCGAHRADRVRVGGNWVVAGGVIPGVGVPDLISRHSAAARAMQAG